MKASFLLSLLFSAAVAFPLNTRQAPDPEGVLPPLRKPVSVERADYRLMLRDDGNGSYTAIMSVRIKPEYNLRDVLQLIRQNTNQGDEDDLPSFVWDFLLAS